MIEKQTRRRRYSKEFKDKAVDLMESGNESVTETARRLGVHRNQLDRWRGERRARGEHCEQAQHGDARDVELPRLRADNRRLREERAVLKKATALFANESS